LKSLVGTTLSHFSIVAKLGEGGMGVVYKATDTTLRRTVALKVLPANVASDPERRRLFLREARAAAAVTHPNLVTIYEVGEADGQVFLALDFIDGRTLRHALDDGRMSVDEALRIARDLARGMARAHEAGIVHRDLKPDNVMIAKDGLLKVLDFGIARVAPKSDPTEPTDLGRETGSALTLEGRVVGTPGYMSPEQARGKPVDATTDVFAFGVVLYEMLAGPS
jgi:serine/threonine protein kinase